METLRLLWVSGIRAGQRPLIMLVTIFTCLGMGSMFAGSAYAQETEDDTLAVGEWANQLTGIVSGSQTGFQNWQEGGVSSLSVSAGISGRSIGVTQNWKHRYEARLAIGGVRLSGREFRKSHDIIRAETSWLYRGTDFFSTFQPTIALVGRTQFAPGYNYQTNPFGDGRELPVKVSDFFSPAIFTQTVGLTYEYGNWFLQRVGLAGKEAVVVDRPLRPVFGVAPDRLARVEVGLETQTGINLLILENTRFESSLTLFKSFGETALPDMFWENLLHIKANQWLTTNVEVVLLYNEDVSRQLQLKEVISLGVTFSFI